MCNPIQALLSFYFEGFLIFRKKILQTSPMLGMVVFLLETVKGAEFNFWICMDLKKLVLLAIGNGGMS